MEQAYCEFLDSPLWWVVLGQLPDAHTAALTLPLLNSTEGKKNMKKLVGQYKDKEITYQ